MFMSRRGAASHCWVGVSPCWPGRAAAVMGCAGECRLPHDPKTGLICNYLLQCCGRLQFVPVQDVDYPARTRARPHTRAPARTH